MDTKQLTMEQHQSSIGNPFASPSEEAIGDYFVGRRRVLDEMHRYIIYPIRLATIMLSGCQELANLLC